MQFCNDERFLGTREMLRDVKEQFVKQSKASQSFLMLPSTLDFFHWFESMLRGSVKDTF